MSEKPEYKFVCQIVDKTTGDVVESDFTYLPIIDKWVGTESAEQSAARLLDVFVRLGRAEYEKANYWPHCDFCGERVERVFACREAKGCAECCDRELASWHEENSQFGVGA